MAELRLTQKQIQAAEDVLRRGDRVELIPVKDGIKIVRVRRSEMCRKTLDA